MPTYTSKTTQRTPVPRSKRLRQTTNASATATSSNTSPSLWQQGDGFIECSLPIKIPAIIGADGLAIYPTGTADERYATIFNPVTGMVDTQSITVNGDIDMQGTLRADGDAHIAGTINAGADVVAYSNTKTANANIMTLALADPDEVAAPHSQYLSDEERITALEAENIQLQQRISNLEKIIEQWTTHQQ